ADVRRSDPESHRCLSTAAGIARGPRELLAARRAQAAAGEPVMSRKAYLWTLGLVYLAWWILMAVEPLDFKDWLMENVLVVLGLALLLFTAKAFPLSRISYTCIFVFMMLHALGAHYTYAKVPYQDW